MAESASTEMTEVQRAWRLMLGRAELRTFDPSEVSDNVSERILAAQSDEDVFAAAELGLQSGENMVGIPLAILDVQWGRSNFADQPGSAPVFAIVKSLTSDGEVTFGIGARSSLVQLFKWEQLEDWADRRQSDSEKGMVFAKVVSKDTNSGNRIFYFGPVTVGERKIIPV